MLLRNEIDCIAADLTVNAERTEVLDFANPFMSSSITLLLKVSQIFWRIYEFLFVTFCWHLLE